MDDAPARPVAAAGNEIDRPVPSPPSNRIWGSDAIAAVRREIWAHQISFMSRPHRDVIEIPRHIWHRMQDALAHAA